MKWIPLYRGNLNPLKADWQSRGNLKFSLYFSRMRVHHTKNKENLGVLKVKLDLFEQEYLILNPETEHSPFDLVAYKDGIFKRIQVKYRTLKKNAAIEVSFRSSHSFQAEQ